MSDMSNDGFCLSHLSDAIEDAKLVEKFCAEMKEIRIIVPALRKIMGRTPKTDASTELLRAGLAEKMARFVVMEKQERQFAAIIKGVA